MRVKGAGSDFRQALLVLEFKIGQRLHPATQGIAPGLGESGKICVVILEPFFMLNGQAVCFISQKVERHSHRQIGFQG